MYRIRKTVRKARYQYVTSNCFCMVRLRVIWGKINHKKRKAVAKSLSHFFFLVCVICKQFVHSVPEMAKMISIFCSDPCGYSCCTHIFWRSWMEITGNSQRTPSWAAPLVWYLVISHVRPSVGLTMSMINSKSALFPVYTDPFACISKQNCYLK